MSDTAASAYQSGSTEDRYPVRTDVPAAPPAELRYRRALEVGTALRLLGRARNIVWGLVVRQVRSTYSQQVLGLAWALVTPLAQMFVFTILLNRVGKKAGLDTFGVPKPLWLFVGLVAWSFFASAVATGGTSLVGNPLLNKVYAPREVFPIAQVASSLINAVASALMLPILMLFTQHGISITVLWAPIPLLLLLAYAVAIALIVSAITVYARDLRSGLPLLLQLGMFLPGVLYPVAKVVPSAWRGVYAAVFPVGSIIDELRACFFLDRAPSASIMALAAVSSVVWLIFGFLFFKRLETGFADVS